MSEVFLTSTELPLASTDEPHLIWCARAPACRTYFDSGSPSLFTKKQKQKKNRLLLTFYCCPAHVKW